MPKVLSEKPNPPHQHELSLSSCCVHRNLDFTLQLGIGTSSWIKWANKVQTPFSIRAHAGAPKGSATFTEGTLYHGNKAGAPPATAPILPVCKLLTLESFWSKESLWFWKCFLIYWNIFSSKEVAIPTLNCFSKTPVFLFPPSLSDSYQLALKAFSTESSPAEISSCCS